MILVLPPIHVKITTKTTYLQQAIISGYKKQASLSEKII
jgi:hypothetical protein